MGSSHETITRRGFLGRLTGLLGAGIGAGALPRRLARSFGELERPRRGGIRTSETQHFYSEPDLEPPVISIAKSVAGQASGYLFTDTHGAGQQGPIVFDSEGNLVWFNVVSDDGAGDLRAFNVRVQTYQGKPVITYFIGTVVEGHGIGHYEILDTSYKLIATVEAQNGRKADLHEFLITEKGTALFTCYLLARADLSGVGGSSDGEYFCGIAQEVDLATNALLHEWRSDEHIAFSESYEPVPTDGSVPWDYFHINSINVDPTDSNLIISGRHTSAVYKVNRTTGAVIWRLSGKESDFYMSQGATFAFQHHATPQANSEMSIFDNGDGPPNNAKQSRGLVLAVDESTMVAGVSAQYLHNPALEANDMGSVQFDASGNRLVGWGPTAYFTEYTTSGEVLLDGHLEGGVLSYRCFRSAWKATPPGPPSGAVVANGETATVYASWNGATEVAHWTVYGGASASSLSAIVTAAKDGFETAIDLTDPPAYVAVQALNAAGAPLGRSAVMKT